MLSSASKCLVLLLAAVALLEPLASARHLERARDHAHWLAYKQQHNKQYGPLEEPIRKARFLEAKRAVEAHNALPNVTYKKALNHLSDWTRAELDQLNGLLSSPELEKNTAAGEAYLAKFLQPGPLPTEVDWRKSEGRVSGVKNQGKCGSCWAFAATGVLEGQQMKFNYTKALVPVSEQDLLDCSFYNRGCNGGLVQWALDDIAALGGIASEQAYPYLADRSETGCRFDDMKALMTDQGHAIGPSQDAKVLMRLVATFGPVATGMYVLPDFEDYASGVFQMSGCPSKRTNHAVLIVGYGTDAKLGDYWLVKNSWGEKWGEQGYFRIKRGVNMCAIEFKPVIPIMTKKQ